MGDWVRVPMKGMQPRAQAVASTCWLNCYGMLYEWRGLDKTTIGPKLKAAGVNVDDAFRNGLARGDMMKAATALGLKPWGAGQSWMASDFKRWLAVSPVWVAGSWRPNSAHIVVVIAASDDQVEFIDPWWQGTEEATISKRFINDFVHGNGTTIKGTDFYLGQIGGVAVWPN